MVQLPAKGYYIKIIDYVYHAAGKFPSAGKPTGEQTTYFGRRAGHCVR